MTGPTSDLLARLGISLPYPSCRAGLVVGRGLGGNGRAEDVAADEGGRAALVGAALAAGAEKAGRSRCSEGASQASVEAASVVLSSSSSLERYTG